MIVSKDINPERDLYYWGARVIEIISLSDKPGFDFFSVYEDLKKTGNLSLNLYTLTLDWLFMIGAIQKSDKGQIIKCF